MRHQIPAERGDEVEVAYGRAQDALRIEWYSAEGPMQGFRKGPHFGAFFAAIRPDVGDITEMRHYDLTAVCGRKEGSSCLLLQVNRPDAELSFRRRRRTELSPCRIPMAPTEKSTHPCW
ncbi:MAG TPA: hypothetical protein VHG93_10980 [Longimicrobium sp.]|nr:hypothetical protein [Longimicrobium sp.]